MITIDRLGINAEKRESPLAGGLEEFAHEVSMLKPLCNFKATDDCLKTEYLYKDETDEQGNTKMKQTRTTCIYKIKVFQEGEELGAISMSERYNRGNKELVYGIHSFRINKERGDRDATLTKNLKVALRTAKKVLVNRQDDELRVLLNTKVEMALNTIVSHNKNYAIYAMDANSEVFNFAILAYHARLKGEATVTLPSTPITLANPARFKDHHEYCEKFTASSFLYEQFKSKLGYSVKVQPDGSMVVLNRADDSVKKYVSFDLLPMDIQGKLAMFKVLNKEEPYAHLGCKFDEDIIYIVADATP